MWPLTSRGCCEGLGAFADATAGPGGPWHYKNGGRELSTAHPRAQVSGGGVKVLVLGASGLQGRAILRDLSRSPSVKRIVAADLTDEGIVNFRRHLNMDVITFRRVDVRNRGALVSLMREDIDVVIDVLPVSLMMAVVEAALDARVDVVNSMYGHALPPGVHERALERGVAIMPEAGLDPGIDLVLCGYGASLMDEVYELHSYCGGFPEPAAADNPLKYKITWTWNGVLLSYKRPARIMLDGHVIEIPAADQHAARWIRTIDFPGVGELELIPNGDAIFFAECLGLPRTLRATSRYSMRWPGHAAFWRSLVALGFLSDEPVRGLPGAVTPHEFMVRHLEPRLQYAAGERDIVAMRNIVVGSRAGVRTTITYEMLDRRDLETGLFAMNRTVGFAASIIAQMIATGEIARKGLLTPIRDVPYRRFIDEITQRGIVIRETAEPAGNAGGERRVAV